VRFDPGCYEVVTGAAQPLRPLKAAAAVQPCSQLDDNAEQQRQDQDARRRVRIILASIDEWRRSGPEMLRQYPGRTWRSWVNAALTVENLDPLTKEEIRTYDS